MKDLIKVALAVRLFGIVSVITGLSVLAYAASYSTPWSWLVALVLGFVYLLMFLGQKQS